MTRLSARSTTEPGVAETCMGSALVFCAGASGFAGSVSFSSVGICEANAAVATAKTRLRMIMGAFPCEVAPYFIIGNS